MSEEPFPKPEQLGYILQDVASRLGGVCWMLTCSDGEWEGSVPREEYLLDEVNRILVAVQAGLRLAEGIGECIQPDSCNPVKLEYEARLLLNRLNDALPATQGPYGPEFNTGGQSHHQTAQILQQFPDQIAAISHRLLSVPAGQLAKAKQKDQAAPLDDLVTLDQAVGITRQSKRTLERYLAQGKLPKPDLPGGGGKSHRWYWSKLRPALQKHFRPDLPEKFPGSRII